MTNQLFYGDNLNVLRESVASESVDLVYLDPPFNSNANYNILFKSPTGQENDAQIEAFEDTWQRMKDAFPGIAFTVEGTPRIWPPRSTWPNATNISFSGGPSRWSTRCPLAARKKARMAA